MLRRRADEKSIGVWKHTCVGRPTAETRNSTNQGRVWIQKCNFTFLVTSLVYDLEHNSAFGWGLEIYPKHLDGTLRYVIPCSVSASSAALRQFFMKLGHSIVCRMGADDFLAFVDQDLRKQQMEKLPTEFVTNFVGKVYIPQLASHFWVFPGGTLDEYGIPTKKDIVKLKAVGRGARLPSIASITGPDRGVEQLAALSSCIRAVYGQKFMHVLHVLTSVLKGIHHDTIMGQEHFVPIANIFGPANTGKTLACAIALQILQSPELMLSRCTASSMIDTADTIRNMLIVWDDPRDCTAAQLSAIVHEAFNGLPNCTISRGTRQYRSSLIIGTQQRCLGMPYNGVNVATFSRLSHISMEGATSSHTRHTKEKATAGFDPTKEAALQEVMKNLGSIFSHLLRTSCYDGKKVHRIYESLREKNPLVINRSLAILAIDCHLAQVLRDCGFTASTSEIKEYFFRQQLLVLQQVCPRNSPLQQFLKDVKCLYARKCKMPLDCFKERVMVDFKHTGPTECFAVQAKEFFPFLIDNLPYAVNYTKEQLQSELRMSSADGAVSHNVAFKNDSGGTVVKRSMVFRGALL